MLLCFFYQKTHLANDRHKNEYLMLFIHIRHSKPHLTSNSVNISQRCHTFTTLFIIRDIISINYFPAYNSCSIWSRPVAKTNLIFYCE